jgi:hypothetical protein
VRPYRAAVVIIAAGLLTFGVVFTLLQVSRSDAAAGSASAPPTPTAEPQPSIARAPDSLAPRIAAGQSAVGVPIAGAESLLRDLQPGDRLDVLASLPAGQEGRPVTAVVVRGATVLRPATSTDPLLVEVPSQEAIILAHLVLGGTRLGYLVWPANGAPPPEPQPIDERTARALLGLTPVPRAPEPTATPAAAATAAPRNATPSPTPTAAAAASTSGFIYQAQPSDTWDSVASTFKLSPDDLRRWNEAPPDAPLEPGTLLFVPRQTP